jgi:hypothetical protein
MHLRLSFVLPFLVASCLLGGCSLSKFAVNTIAGGMAGSTDVLRATFDYEVAGQGAAASIMQLEAFHSISPDNETLTLALAQNYIAYGYGWVGDAQQQALHEKRFDDAERHKQRSYLMFSRAKDLIVRAMHGRDPEVNRVLVGNQDKLAAYLKENYDDPEDDVALVLWLAVSWGTVIESSPNTDDLIDLPNVKVLAEHARALDEKYEDAAALALLGGLEAAYPQQLGGDLEKGRVLIEKAIAIAGRRNHVQLVNFANSYAVNAQNRALYVSLLREVIEAPDQGNAYRLSNKVARRRAERHLQHVDELF